MLEVKSIPQDDRVWTRCLLLLAMLVFAAICVITEDSFWIGALVANFAGWIVTQGNRRTWLRAILIAMIIGLLAGCAIESMTLGTSVLDRSMSNFSPTNLAGYAIATASGIILGFCE